MALSLALDYFPRPLTHRTFPAGYCVLWDKVFFLNFHDEGKYEIKTQCEFFKVVYPIFRDALLLLFDVREPYAEPLPLNQQHCSSKFPSLTDSKQRNAFKRCYPH